MGKSLRSKSKVKFRNIKRAKIFEPAEEARRQRLAEKLLGHVKVIAKESKKQGEVEDKDKENSKNNDRNSVIAESENVEGSMASSNVASSNGMYFSIITLQNPTEFKHLIRTCFMLDINMDIDNTPSKVNRTKVATSGWKSKAKKHRSFRRKR